MSARPSARAFAVALALAAAPVFAQEVTIVHREGERQVLNLLAEPFAGASRIGGYGFLTVRVQNVDERAHDVVVVLHSPGWVEHDVSLQRSLRVGPGEHAAWTMPLPGAANPMFRLGVRIDGTRYDEDLRARGSEGPDGLLLGEQSLLVPKVQDALQRVSGHAKAEVVMCHADAAPEDWRLFTGFAVVFVDGRATVPGPVQEALRRYVAAGGSVVVGGPDSLPAGAAHDAFAGRTLPTMVPLGLGQWLGGAAFGEDVRPMVQLLNLAPRPGTGAIPAPVALLRSQPVAALGQAPVGVFVLVLLAFAVLAGPVNFTLLRRRRRPLLALVTVPVLGFGTTLLMVGYGMFHDGFGVRGVVRSWTWLDQERHEASAWATRTLFAGLSPDRLQPAADTLLMAPTALGAEGRNGTARLEWDLDRGVVDGGVLPSRTVAALATLQQGVVRARLRLSVREGGGLTVLDDGGIRPVGRWVLRDREGRWWLGDGPALREVDEAAAMTEVRELRTAARRHVVIGQPDPRRWSRGGYEELAQETTEDEHLHALAAAWGREEALWSGSYLLRVASPAWLDECGLRVAYDESEHFVYGRIAAEDVVR